MDIQTSKKIGTQALGELYNEFNVIDDRGAVGWMTFLSGAGDFLGPISQTLETNWKVGLMTIDIKNVGPIEALYNNTAMLTPNGPLGYLVNNNALDLSNPFIMADLSALTSVPNVQEALTMMIMSVVYTKLANAKPGAPVKRTLLTLDEGADLVKNPTMEGSIEKFFRQGRAWGMYTR